MSHSYNVSLSSALSRSLPLHITTPTPTQLRTNLPSPSPSLSLPSHTITHSPFHCNSCTIIIMLGAYLDHRKTLSALLTIFTLLSFHQSQAQFQAILVLLLPARAHKFARDWTSDYTGIRTSHVFRPEIEPGSTAWKSRALTTQPAKLYLLLAY